MRTMLTMMLWHNYQENGSAADRFQTYREDEQKVPETFTRDVKDDENADDQFIGILYLENQIRCICKGACTRLDSLENEQDHEFASKVQDRNTSIYV